ncbi:hypothetical protein ASPFODRAFT_127854 [Aspergillus luchuensis CBS 106.47]|uniref:Major facilitator superfamily (MFS) profile domain-containing protein n=1 Tax=Aspergillus luchuensis (strain CBS 106.47) TaxID=1137211 RepID=A0A1M3TQB7_ASPLC|nr:hypothetical protein ASPFODRAFT_127854 [Aspergillus luchuensis CBS 106.47]
MSNRTEDAVENPDVKADISELEYVKGNAPGNAGPTFSIEDENRVYRKLDWNLMPLVFVLYSLSVLDRSNLGNAKIAGMEDDIDLSGRRYDWLATAFYIAYILSQWTTIGWKAFPPHRWVGVTVFLWGFVSTIQSACTNWAGLMVCRVFLGIIEAMYGPGVPLYLSYFYPREKLGLRTGIFLSGAALANAYGSALAYGISQAKGSIGPWRILFIVEGVPSCLLAIVAWFCLPDSPKTARFLDEREQEIAVALSLRQPGDRETQGLQLKQVLGSLLDYTSYPPALMYFGCNVCFASLPLFVPTIISEMGAFTTIQSNGLSAPPYVLCWIAIVISAFLSDRVNLRGPFIVGGALIAAIGYIVLATQTTVAVRYFGLFLATQVFVSVALILTWVGNTHATDSKRAGAFAILATGGQCGPILGTNVFPDSDKPYYRKGMWISCGACLIVVVMGCWQMYLLWRANRHLDRESEQNGGNLSGDQSEGKNEADRPFRYIL